MLTFSRCGIFPLFGRTELLEQRLDLMETLSLLLAHEL